MNAPPPPLPSGRGILRLPAFTRRALTAVGIAVAAFLVLFVVWRTREVLLLAFGGVLLAVALRGVSEWVRAHSPLSSGWALGVVLVTLVGALALAVTLRGPAVADQAHALREALPQALNALAVRLSRYEWGRAIVDELRPLLISSAGASSGMLSRAQAIATGTLAVLAKLLIVVITGIYVAAEPRWYAGGLVALVPKAGRERAWVVLDELGRTLRAWLLVRAVSMVFVGVLTGVGLWVLGVPLVFTLGLLAAVLDLVPNFGPVVAAVPGVMLAFLQGPRQALYVALLYFGVQVLGAYGLTPWMERRTVALPPALVLTMQAALGVLAGVVGLAFAAPATLAALVLVRMLYVGDVLGDGAAGEPATGSTPASAGNDGA